MKRRWLALGIAVLLLALGSAGYAAVKEDAEFTHMLPFMRQMHPNMTGQQYEEMYQSCHANRAVVQMKGHGMHRLKERQMMLRMHEMR